jgi:hypothetical protein
MYDLTALPVEQRSIYVGDLTPDSRERFAAYVSRIRGKYTHADGLAQLAAYRESLAGVIASGSTTPMGAATQIAGVALFAAVVDRLAAERS